MRAKNTVGWPEVGYCGEMGLPSIGKRAFGNKLAEHMLSVTDVRARIGDGGKQVRAWGVKLSTSSTQLSKDTINNLSTENGFKNINGENGEMRHNDPESCLNARKT